MVYFDLMFELVLYLYILFSSPNYPKVLGASSVALASRSFSLEGRYGSKFVNDVFKDNILLTFKYMDGSVKEKTDISWENVEKPFHYEFTLAPGEEFAFHDQILPEYDKNVVKTTNAHFNSYEGFKSDGYLIGDGVCHLASLIYWAAKDAGLNAIAPTNHNFAIINEVPKEYGVSIFAVPKSATGGERQNLYIINSLENPVTFAFDYDGAELTVSVLENTL